MNQEKIGKFIATLRKENNLTQMQLAEALNITDRAVSKWERGKSLPDVSVMLDLCQILHIEVSELLNGERIMKENYNEKQQELLLQMAKQKQEADKRLLHLEIVIGAIALVYFLGILSVAAYLPMADWLQAVLIVGAFIPFLCAMFYGLRIEQVAGYYECKKCGHKYVPAYKSVFFAMHMNRTRYMKCPECHKWSWQKKVLTKED